MNAASRTIQAVDLFCGIGGLTHGLRLAGIDVRAGFDNDAACRYAFEANNGDAEFVCKDIRNVAFEDLSEYFGAGAATALVGCAPCQPFSAHNRRRPQADDDCSLVDEFARLVKEGTPDFVSIATEVDVDLDPEAMTITVRDNGIGMDLDRHQREVPLCRLPQARWPTVRHCARAQADGRKVFQYAEDYASRCPNLDRDTGNGHSMQYDRPHRFKENGNADPQGCHSVSGWIAIAHRSNDLDRDGGGDNLNKIAVVVRGKVAQEDILQEFRLGGMITKFMFGEIAEDFLDQDDKDDIATSSRQSIAVDDPRFQALKAFLDTELRHIWTETNKDKRGLQNALAGNAPLKEWYDELPAELKLGVPGGTRCHRGRELPRDRQ